MSFTAMATWLRRPIMAPPSDFDDEDMAGRLLAPDLVDGVAHRAFDGGFDRLRIAALCPRQAIERVAHGVGDELGQGLALFRLRRQAHGVDNRIACNLAL